VDIWGLGCILGELLFCANNKKIDKKFDPNHRFLFAGKSCFPLSSFISDLSALEYHKSMSQR